MKNQIKDVHLEFACDAKWEEMTNCTGGKVCHRCQKKVYDLTNSTQRELNTILKENNYDICAKFTTDQLNTTPLFLSSRKKWFSAALLLLGINLFNSKVNAQNTRVSVNQEELNANINFALGKVVMPLYDSPPMFPGGIDSLNNFLSKNIHNVSWEGEVRLSISVNKRGKVDHFKVLDVADLVTYEEISRVIKLFPKWEPAKLKGRPIATTYEIPLLFKK